MFCTSLTSQQQHITNVPTLIRWSRNATRPVHLIYGRRWESGLGEWVFISGHLSHTAMATVVSSEFSSDAFHYTSTNNIAHCRPLSALTDNWIHGAKCWHTSAQVSCTVRTCSAPWTVKYRSIFSFWLRRLPYCLHGLSKPLYLICFSHRFISYLLKVHVVSP